MSNIARIHYMQKITGEIHFGLTAGRKGCYSLLRERTEYERTGFRLV